MKKLIKLYPVGHSRYKASPVKEHGRKLIKVLVIVVVFVSISVLTSCAVESSQQIDKPGINREQRDNHSGRYNMGLKIDQKKTNFKNS